MIRKNDLIYIAGHRGMVGSAILRKLKKEGYKNILTRTRKQLNLLDTNKTYNFLLKFKPKFIFVAAAKVGGIYYHTTHPADAIYQNLLIQNNIIHGAFSAKIKDLIFLGSSCIYPKNCKQPMKENYLLSGKLEETNEGYAIAKIAGVKMCESFNKQYNTNYKCLMPTNAFGPNDNYNPKNSHFVPALIRKIHLLKKSKKKIKKLIVWGNGKAKREIIHADDIADACIFFMNKKDSPYLINIGTGKEYSIEYYAKAFSKYMGVNIKIVFDKSKPNGVSRKLMDISLAKKHGWKSKILLKDAIVSTYRNYLNEK